MLIRSLTLENYRQYRGTHRIDFPVDYASNKNIVLIGGLNGAGKTSILEGLRLVLFGKGNDDLWEQTSYKSFIRQCLNKVARNSGAREFRLSVLMEIGEVQASSTLEIERRWRFSEAYELAKETVRLFSNGKEKLGLSPEESELFIQEQVPIGVSRFVFFDGEKIQELARDDSFSTDTNRAIRSVLGLGLHQELEHDLWLYERNLLRDSASGGEFKAVEQALDRARSQLEALRKQKSQLNKELVDAQGRLVDIQAERKRVGGQQLRDRQEIDEVLAGLRAQREVIQKELSAFVSHDLPFLMLRPLMSRLRTRLQLEVETEQRYLVRTLLGRKRSELVDAFRLAGGQDLEALNVALDLSIGVEEQVQIRHRNLTIDQKYALISRVGAAEGKVSQQAQQLLRDLDAADHKIRKVTQDKRSLPTDAAYLDLEERERGLMSDIAALSSQLGGAAVQERILEHEHAAAQRAYEIAMRELKLSQEVEAKVLKARAIRETVTEFINRLARKKAEEVQRYLTRMFLDLARKESLVGEFFIDPTTFAVDVADASGNEVELSALSAGEKEIFAISFLWALSKAAVRELPMVIDTPLGRLDSIHRAHIAEKFLPNANRQVIVLSTDSEIDGELYRRISDFVAASYVVEYLADQETSAIRPGYFFSEGVASDVH